MEQRIARRVVATGTDAREVARELATGLAAPALRFAFVFADWRLDASEIASGTYHGLRAPVVGGSTIGVIGSSEPGACAAVALGFYGDWARFGIGVAPAISKSPLTRSRDAVNHAASALGLEVDALDPSRQLAITVVDGTCGHEEAFCIGSAAAAPRIRFVGGCTSTSTETDGARRSVVWVNGELMRDAGVVILLDSDRAFYPLTSSHLVPTDERTVVTGCAGRVIHELDGRPAATRLRELVGRLGETLQVPRPAHSFARYVDGLPYVRSMTRIEGEQLFLASAVEPGQVLKLMRPGDLIGTTRRDLELAAAKVGGSIEALLAFSCIGRHTEAKARGLERELAECYADYPTVGLQSSGEQAGMLLVNHTLTGLAIGRMR